LETAFGEIADERQLPREIILEALQTALVSAYKRYAGVGSAQQVEARIDPVTWRPRIFVEKEVVDEVVYDATEVTLEKARFYNPEAQFGDTVMVQVEGSTKRFGRIAAQTAKQVILQKIREAEREALYEEYAEREGDLITGTVQSVTPSNVTLSLGRAEAVLPRNQQIPRERYRPHEKLRTYCLEVKRSNRGPQIIVSRSHRNMLRRLLEYEVPEIFNGQVEIKSIAREAGYRSKVAVAALQDGIDPVGACVGMRGIRIQNIVKELHDEKIDVIEWNPNHEQFISKALSPARVTGVYLDDDPYTGRTAVVIVPDDQLSLAIGREGQNARLAAKLTGWRIDIKSVTEAVEWALENLDHPLLSAVKDEHPDMVADVRRILAKRAENRAIMPEEYNILGKFADIVEREMLMEREEERRQRLEEINAVKSTLPTHAFQIPVDALELPKAVIEALQPLENAGEIMLRFLIDEERIRELLVDMPESVLEQVQEALDKAVFADEPELEFVAEADVPETTVEPEAVAEVGEDVVRAAFGGDIIVEGPEIPVKVAVVDDDLEVFDDEGDDGILQEGGKKKKKGKQKRRQLIYDEDAGKMIAKRRRKGSRKRNEWDEWDE
jgi:N utilization substance protein A